MRTVLTNRCRLLIPIVLAMVITIALAACAQIVPTPMAAPQATTEQAAARPPSPTDTLVPTEAPTIKAIETPPKAMRWSADGIVSEREYAQSVTEADVTFYWRTDGTSLFGALSAKTTGWVAVAFDPETRMRGANFVYGYVKDGEATLFDMFGVKPTGPDSHPPDDSLGGSNDILAFGGRESEGKTVIEFQIPLDSGDSYDKPLVVGQKYNILLAWGPNDGFSYHGGRGTTMMSLE